MQSQNWGEATSIPPNVDGGVCAVPLRNGLIALDNSNLVDGTGDYGSVILVGLDEIVGSVS